MSNSISLRDASKLYRILTKGPLVFDLRHAFDRSAPIKTLAQPSASRREALLRVLASEGVRLFAGLPRRSNTFTLAVNNNSRWSRLAPYFGYSLRTRQQVENGEFSLDRDFDVLEAAPIANPYWDETEYGGDAILGRFYVLTNFVV